jgi:hypothetical protein
MVSFDTSSFNWIAIVLAGLSAWIIGGIWFSPPVFGRRWMKALGLTQTGNPAPGFVAALVIAIIWFAFILLPSAPSLLFTKSSGSAFAIVQAQHAVAMSVMGIILTLYH